MGKMGKTFVVLVSLYIGLVSGFIVPSGAPELLKEESANLVSHYAKFNHSELKEDATSIINGLTNNNFSKNRQTENILYEYGTEKVNSINERSLLLLNQKFRTPLLNKFNGEKVMAYFIPSHNEEISLLNHFGLVHVPRKPVKVGKFNFQLNLNREMHDIRDPAGYFVPHNQALNKDAKIKSFTNQTEQHALLTSRKGKDLKKKFVQVLDPPPVNAIDNKHLPLDIIDKNNAVGTPFEYYSINQKRIQKLTDIKPSKSIRSRFRFWNSLSKLFLDKHRRRIEVNKILDGNLRNKDDKNLLQQNFKEDKIAKLLRNTVDHKSSLKNSESNILNCKQIECFRPKANKYSKYNSEELPICKCLISNNARQRERKELTTFTTEDTKFDDMVMEEYIL